MALPLFPSPLFRDAWDVFLLFTIPVGGGIPGGVLLAQSRGLAWPTMMALYFVSDVVLAFVFEPLMLLLIRTFRHVERVQNFASAFRRVLERSAARHMHSTGPLALVLVAFGVDPMTGRAAAKAEGHGFVTGWMIAIAGHDVFFGGDGLDALDAGHPRRRNRRDAGDPRPDDGRAGGNPPAARHSRLHGQSLIRPRWLRHPENGVPHEPVRCEWTEAFLTPSQALGTTPIASTSSRREGSDKLVTTTNVVAGGFSAKYLSLTEVIPGR